VNLLHLQVRPVQATRRRAPSTNAAITFLPEFRIDAFVKAIFAA
jgi:hypothetical protein